MWEDRTKFLVVKGIEPIITRELHKTNKQLIGIGRSGPDNRELVLAFSDGHTIHLEADHNGMIQFKKMNARAILEPLTLSGIQGKM